MPTHKPRVAVTLEPHVHETIARLAQLQGVSRGHVIADLLEGVHPPLMRTVALLEAAREAPEEVKRGLRGTLESMERELYGEQASVLAQLDWVMERAVREGEGAGGKRSAPAPSPGPVEGGSNPRPGNTGVRSGKSLNRRRPRRAP